MRLPKGKVAISVDIKAYTRHPNGSKTQSKDGLESRIEKFLHYCYKAYIKHLVSQLPNAGQYELVEVDEHNMDLRRKKK